MKLGDRRQTCRDIGMMRMGHVLVIAILTLSGCGQREEVVPVNAMAYKDELVALSKARIFFGHQSVGRNLLQGLSDLSQQAGVPLRIVHLESGGTGDQPGVFHTDIGKNREPLGKLSEFSRLVQISGQKPYDVALLKFCYEDIRADAPLSPRALVDEYAKQVAAIRAAQPNLRLVHVTSPLRADPLEWKTAIKRVIGRSTYEDADNQLRNTFNAEMRKRFAGEAIFDIAEVESSLAQEKRSAFNAGSETVFTLAAAYTTDGGHLNEAGRQRVAAAFVRAVAGAMRR